MSTRALRGLALAALLASAPGAAHAAGFGLMHEASVHADAANKPMKGPEGIACLADGRFLVADTGNGRFLRYTVAGRKVTGGEELRIAGITAPTRIHVAKNGELWVLDARARKLFRLDANGALIGPVTFSGVPSGKALEVGAFALDGTGNLYVYDLASSTVVVTSESGAWVKELMLPAGRRAITDVHVDPAGVVWVVDALSSTLFAAAKSDTVLTPRTKSLKKELEFPVYMTSSDRAPVVVDGNGSRLVLLTADGQVLSGLLSMGQRDGFIYYPSQICMNGLGQLLVADRGNHRIQVFRTTR